jgi:PAS domain S-box-containing protein
MFDHDMKYIVASRRFLKDYKLSDQDIIGRSHYEVLPDVPEHWKEIHRRCLAGAVEKCEEDPFPRANGKTDWVRWEIHPWYETQGEIGGIILFSEVITERKEAEAALRLSEEKFATTFRNSPEAIALTSVANGQFVEVNESFLRLSGYSLDEIIGHTTLDLGFWVNPAERQRYLDLMQESGRVTNMETDFQKKSGEILISLVSGELIEVQGSVYILTVINDITERKQAELELKHHRDHLEELVQERTTSLEESQRSLMNIVEDLNLKTEELEQANTRLLELDRLKSMFIASMSHELRTPLNSIIGFTGLIIGDMVGAISDEQRDMLGRVSRAGKHLLSLITDVIDIAKIESGKIVPYPEDVDLQTLLDEAIGQVRPQAGEKGIAIEVHLPEPLLVIHSDRKRLLQCLLNYLSNAVKFSEKGTVTVKVKTATRGEGPEADGKRLPEGWIEISIMDTGIGIREEDMTLLFGSFVRLDTPLKATIPGTGLGLYLTKKLTTEVLGGTVGAESEEGKGSRFWLRIPMNSAITK